MAEKKKIELGKIIIKVTTQGRRYDIRLGELTATDEMEFKAVTGADFFQLLESANATVMAGLVWVWRRKFGEDELDFEDVAAKFTWADLDTVDHEMAGEAKGSPKTPKTGTPVPEGATGPEG